MLKIISCVVFVGGCCHDPAPVPAPAPAPAPAPVPATGDDCGVFPKGPCQGLSCGTGNNSPYTNLFPANGISPAGRCNLDRIRYVAGSTHGGGGGNGKKTCDGAELSLMASADGGSRLVAWKNGKVKCEHTDLEGVTFTLNGQHPVELAIQKVTDKPPFEQYLITYHGTSVCDFATSIAVVHDLGYDNPYDQGDLPPVEHPLDHTHDPAIAVGGAAYSIGAASPLAMPSDFFNLACAEDALAKVFRNQLSDVSDAAIRMFTAKYKGAVSYTVRDVPIAWEVTHSEPMQYFEAYWNEVGEAMCLDTPRLEHVAGKAVVGQTGTDITSQLPKLMQPAACQTKHCTPSEWSTELKKLLQLHACPPTPPTGAVLKSYLANGVVVVKDLRVKSTSAPPPTGPTHPDPAGP